MKRFVIYSVVFLFGYALFLDAQEEKKEHPAKIVGIAGGIAIQEPVSHVLLTKHSLYFVQNEREEKKYRISRFGSRPIGIVPDKVKLDHRMQANPLYDDSIDFIAPNHEENLYVVGHKDPATLYLFTAAYQESEIAMISAPDIHDAEGNATAGVVGLASGMVADAKERTSYTFLAVKKHEGNFGQPGSGIAVVRYDPDIKKEEKDSKKNKPTQDDKKNKEKNEEVSKPFFDILDASTGLSKGNKAYPLDDSCDALSINHGLGDIHPDVIDMYWDVTLQRCYIALQVKTKSDAGDDQGVCGLLVGRIRDKKLHLAPVVTPKAFQADQSMLGAIGSNKQVSLHKVRTMLLNNGLNYLVVVGGNGAGNETLQKVYAFPLVNAYRMPQDVRADGEDIHGTIAKKGSIPSVKSYENGAIEARIFEDPVENKDDFYSSDDRCVQVGGSAILPGPIHALATRGDCVIAAIKEDGNGKAAGVFYSQAIMNEFGTVESWTPWQRVPGGDKKTLQIIPRIGEFRILSIAGPDEYVHLQSTAWHIPRNISKNLVMALDPVQACIESQFPHGSLYGITDYPVATPGVSGTDALSLLVALGTQQVVMMQTSEADEHGIVRPIKAAYEKIYNSTDGSLSGIAAKESDVRAVRISGGVLERCGALSTSAIGVYNDHAWLFVGGSGGLAVLANKNGSGWSAQSGLCNGFNALNNEVAFKLLGNYTFIRKLICCDGYLYVLTNSGLDRIRLAPEQFANSSEIKIERLINNVTRDDGKKIFLNDVIISSDLLLLATSEGLYSAVPESKLTLRRIELPQGQQPVMNLFTVSPTGYENGFAYGGQVYLVARSSNYKESYIYRLFVDVSRGADAAVGVMQDCYKKDAPTYWIRYAAPQQGFVTDGISFYSYCSRVANHHTHLSLIPASDIRSRSILKGIHISQLPLDLKDAHAIRAMIHNSATGGWLLAGDFGLRINM